jgi:hypothetical protein
VVIRGAVYVTLVGALSLGRHGILISHVVVVLVAKIVG